MQILDKVASFLKNLWKNKISDCKLKLHHYQLGNIYQRSTFTLCTSFFVISFRLLHFSVIFCWDRVFKSPEPNIILVSELQISACHLVN